MAVDVSDVLAYVRVVVRPHDRVSERGAVDVGELDQAARPAVTQAVEQVEHPDDRDLRLLSQPRRHRRIEPEFFMVDVDEQLDDLAVVCELGGVLAHQARSIHRTGITACHDVRDRSHHDSGTYCDAFDRESRHLTPPDMDWAPRV